MNNDEDFHHHPEDESSSSSSSRYQGSSPPLQSEQQTSFVGEKNKDIAAYSHRENVVRSQQPQRVSSASSSSAAAAAAHPPLPSQSNTTSLPLSRLLTSGAENELNNRDSLQTFYDTRQSERSENVGKEDNDIPHPNTNDSALLPAPEQMILDDFVNKHVAPRDQGHIVRMAMTLLLALLIPAALLTLWAVPSSYGFLLIMLWILLLSLFVAFVWFVQINILDNTRRIFHPYVHAAADMVVQEYRDFCQDWHDQLLLLTDGDASANEDENDEYTPQQQQSKQRRKVKSKVFKLVVKPFLPFIARRKRRRRRRKQQQQERASQDKDDDVVVEQATASGYVPPAQPLEGV